MSTLADIKAAVDSLPSEQKEELLRFLAERLRGRATTWSIDGRRKQKGISRIQGAQYLHVGGRC